MERGTVRDLIDRLSQKRSVDIFTCPSERGSVARRRAGIPTYRTLTIPIVMTTDSLMTANSKALVLELRVVVVL